MNALLELVRQHGPLLGILAPLAGVLLPAFLLYKSAHDKRVTTLEDKVRRLQGVIDSDEGPHKLLVAHLRQQLQDARGEVVTLKARHDSDIDSRRSKVKAAEGSVTVPSRPVRV